MKTLIILFILGSTFLSFSEDSVFTKNKIYACKKREENNCRTKSIICYTNLKNSYEICIKWYDRCIAVEKEKCELDHTFELEEKNDLLPSL